MTMPLDAQATMPPAPKAKDDARPARPRRAGAGRDLRVVAEAPPPAPTAEDGAATGRQLRIARRVAQRHGIRAGSDAEAVEKLRARGIDPFDRAGLPQIVPLRPQAGDAPVIVAAPPPGRDGMAREDAERAAEVMTIQTDIARRRRKRLRRLGRRLGLFVALPTLVAGLYFAFIATPLFATKSEFVIQQADTAAAGGSGLGGLFAGTGLAAQQDSIAVQGYLTSRDAFRRLDADEGFRAHFAAASIDPLRGIGDDGTDEAAYRLYRRMVQIGYDPTEGVVRMEVSAADPETAARFSRALIAYAEAQVDDLTGRLRADQMSGAAASFDEAEAKMLAAQARVVELQEQLGVVSADAELSNAYGQIGAVESALREERLQLDALRDNRRPNPTRVAVGERRIAQLEAELATLREGLTQAGGAADSLARVTAELGMAQMDLQTRQLLLQQAAQQMETARIEANRQTRYLSTPVPPLPPDEATYPRLWASTALAALIFAGIYLMASLTVAILREQVSA